MKLEKFTRVMAILIQLQSRKIVRAKDIADRFEISIRTVYRDIQTLEEAGVPISSEVGVGYSLTPGYKLPPVMFTKTEATAFLTAEKLIEKFTDCSIETSYKSAMMKIRAVLRSSEKELLENIEQNIEIIRRRPHLPSIAKLDRLQTIIECISEKKAISIKYHSFYSNETNDRTIEPIGIFFVDSNWHTIAFCELRNDYRDFRLDRIIEIEKTETNYKKKHPSIKDYLSKLATKQNLETVVLKVENDTAKFLKEQMYYFGFISEKIQGEYTEMTFLTSNINYFVRWFISFADKAEIIAPDSLIFSFKMFLSKLNKNYQ